MSRWKFPKGYDASPEARRATSYPWYVEIIGIVVFILAATGLVYILSFYLH